MNKLFSAMCKLTVSKFCSTIQQGKGQSLPRCPILACYRISRVSSGATLVLFFFSPCHVFHPPGPLPRVQRPRCSGISIGEQRGHAIFILSQQDTHG